MLMSSGISSGVYGGWASMLVFILSPYYSQVQLIYFILMTNKQPTNIPYIGRDSVARIVEYSGRGHWWPSRGKVTRCL